MDKNKKLKKKKKTGLKIIKVKKIINNNKNLLFIIGLLILDVILIIWSARSNVANYVNINGNDVFVGDTKNLVFGRNYITLVITFFIYIYGFLFNKILLKNEKKCVFFVLVFVALLVINMLLFFMFTNRVY